MEFVKVAVAGVAGIRTTIIPIRFQSYSMYSSALMDDASGAGQSLNVEISIV